MARRQSQMGGMGPGGRGSTLRGGGATLASLPLAEEATLATARDHGTALGEGGAASVSELLAGAVNLATVAGSGAAFHAGGTAAGIELHMKSLTSDAEIAPHITESSTHGHSLI
jgi:hypothetical protein